MSKCRLISRFAFAVIMIWGLVTFVRADEQRVFIETPDVQNHAIVIPGLTSSPDVFKDVMPNWPGGYHWVTVGGFGGAVAPSDLDAVTVPAAQEIAKYLQNQDLRNVALIGHSMGGVLALLAAAEQPDRIDRILIIDSVPFLAGLMQPGVNSEDAAARKAAIRQQFGDMPREQFLAVMRQGLPVQATTAEAQGRVWVDIERSDQEAVAVASSEIFTADYRDILPLVKAKVTVLIPHNQFSPLPAEDIKMRYAQLYEGLENVEFHIIPESRHFIMLDQPSAFKSHVELFLTGGDDEE